MAFLNKNFGGWKPYYEVVADWDKEVEMYLEIFPAKILVTDDCVYLYGKLDVAGEKIKKAEKEDEGRLVFVAFHLKPYKLFKEDKNPNLFELSAAEYLKEKAASVDSPQRVMLSVAKTFIDLLLGKKRPAASILPNMIFFADEESEDELPVFDPKAGASGGQGGYKKQNLTEILEKKEAFLISRMSQLLPEAEKSPEKLLDILPVFSDSSQKNEEIMMEMIKIILG